MADTQNPKDQKPEVSPAVPILKNTEHPGFARCPSTTTARHSRRFGKHPVPHKHSTVENEIPLPLTSQPFSGENIVELGELTGEAGLVFVKKRSTARQPTDDGSIRRGENCFEVMIETRGKLRGKLRVHSDIWDPTIEQVAELVLAKYPKRKFTPENITAFVRRFRKQRKLNGVIASAANGNAAAIPAPILPVPEF
jgi:hypothetical protein